MGLYLSIVKNSEQKEFDPPSPINCHQGLLKVVSILIVNYVVVVKMWC
jgi:hypothetical protein